MANTPLVIPELEDKFKDYRDEIWGDSYSWAWERRSDEIKYLVIHHSVTAHEATPDYIAQLHKARGWGGIGYHFIITKDGIVWYVGDISTARANVADMNEKVIGICLIGDFTQYLPSDEQIISAHKLCQFFIDVASIPNVNSWDNVVGHKELKPTQCPGSSWDKSQDSDMWWRIKTGTVYTSPAPIPPTPEATETGQTVAIGAYQQLVEDLNAILKLPIGNKDFVKVQQKCAELMVTAENYDKFLKRVAKGIGCTEVSETAVLEALAALEDHVSVIKTQRLEDFGAIERIVSGLMALLPKRG